MRKDSTRRMALGTNEFFHLLQLHPFSKEQKNYPNLFLCQWFSFNFRAFATTWREKRKGKNEFDDSCLRTFREKCFFE
jgi:hypothetical protein